MLISQGAWSVTGALWVSVIGAWSPVRPGTLHKHITVGRAASAGPMETFAQCRLSAFIVIVTLLLTVDCYLRRWLLQCKCEFIALGISRQVSINGSFVWCFSLWACWKCSRKPWFPSQESTTYIYQSKNTLRWDLEMEIRPSLWENSSNLCLFRPKFPLNSS